MATPINRYPVEGWNRTKFEDKYMIMLDGCWVWEKPNANGYGKVRHDGRVRQAHRVSFEIHRGPVPPDLTLDHLCRNRACVNPWHLEPVTHQENCRRGALARR